MWLLELKTKIQYYVAWLMWRLGVRGVVKLADLKTLYAKAMAAKWCPKKDQKFCQLAFYKLYNVDLSNYLTRGDPVVVLTLALYDVERGQHALPTVKNYVHSGVLPLEVTIFVGQKDVKTVIPVISAILKELGEATLEQITAAWHITSVKTRALPPLERILDNVVVAGILSQMENEGYVKRVGDRYVLTEEGASVAKPIQIPEEVKKLKSFKYVNSYFYAFIRYPPE
ncbi:MAG: hypothetical protein QXP31_10670 [Pyrobaculum sp.]